MRPNVTGAEMRKGPTRAPLRWAISAIASSTSCAMRDARSRKVTPSSVRLSLRVLRCTSLTPRLRSSSTSRSLTTDFDSRNRRAASLIDPASATATKVAMPSSFIIVRTFRRPVSPFGA